jgi:hypothetical protein
MRNRLFFIFPSAHNLTAMLALCNLIFITYSLPLLRQLYWFFPFLKKRRSYLSREIRTNPPVFILSTSVGSLFLTTPARVRGERKSWEESKEKVAHGEESYWWPDLLNSMRLSNVPFFCEKRLSNVPLTMTTMEMEIYTEHLK